MAKNLETRVTLTDLTRNGHTTNGNPRWRIHTTSGTWTLQSDAQLGYALENPECRDMINHTKAHRVHAIRLA